MCLLALDFGLERERRASGDRPWFLLTRLDEANTQAAVTVARATCPHKGRPEGETRPRAYRTGQGPDSLTARPGEARGEAGSRCACRGIWHPGPGHGPRPTALRTARPCAWPALRLSNWQSPAPFSPGGPIQPGRPCAPCSTSPPPPVRCSRATITRCGCAGRTRIDAPAVPAGRPRRPDRRVQWPLSDLRFPMSRGGPTDQTAPRDRTVRPAPPVRDGPGGR